MLEAEKRLQYVRTQGHSVVAAWVRRTPMIEVLLTLVGVGWIIVVFEIIMAGYVGSSFTGTLVAGVGDEWCIKATEAIGRHCFGDFGYPRNFGGFAEFYTEHNLVVNNTPLTLLAFRIVHEVPYRAGLLIYLSIISAAPAIAVWRGTRGQRASLRAAALTLSGCLSTGAIVAFDRGNAVGLTVPFVLVLILGTKRWHLVGAVAALLSIKFWTPLFLVILLARRRTEELALGVLAAIVLFFGPLALLTGSPIDGVRMTILAVFHRPYGDFVSAFSVSWISMLRRVSCLTGHVDVCGGGEMEEAFPPLLLLLLVVAGSLWISWRAATRSDWPLALRYAPVVSLGFVLVPEAGAYNLVLCSVITVLIARDSMQWRGHWPHSVGRSYPALVVATAISTVPLLGHWQYPWRPEAPNDNLDYWTTPIAWAVFFVFVVLDERRSRHQRSGEVTRVADSSI